MEKRKNWAISVILSFLVLAVLVSAPQAAPIKIGLEIPFSGNDALEGQNIKRGTDMAAEEINKAGGVLGEPLQLVVGDNQCDSAVGVAAIRRLIDSDKVVVTLGSLCSSVSLAVMPILQQQKIASLDVTATNPQITAQSGVGGNIWKFRMNLNDLLMNQVFAKDIIGKEASKLAIFSVNTDYGRGVIDVVKQTIPGKVVTTEFFQYGDADFRPQLTRIKAAGADGILIAADSPEAAKIITQMYELGLKMKIYGRGTVVTDGTLSLLQKEALPIFEGAKEVNFWIPNPDAGDLQDRYKAKYGEVMLRDNGMGYFGIKVLEQAIKNCGKITGGVVADRACIRDGLEKVDMNLAGLGRIKFDDHHQAHYSMFITAIRNGKVVILNRVPTD
jgi:branched-chain amino acid transport system substrate-binding protein